MANLEEEFKKLVELSDAYNTFAASSSLADILGRNGDPAALKATLKMAEAAIAIEKLRSPT